MIKEIIEFITGLKRPELIETRNGEYLYDDTEGRYNRVGLMSFTREVCNVDSFAKAVLEEVKRDGEDSNGFGMTVIFNRHGGIFYTDDVLGNEQNTWLFRREFTHLWEVIQKLTSGHKFAHRQLLDALESVKIFIPGFEKFYQIISKLRASKKVQFVSNPIFQDGEQGGDFSWEQKIDSNGSTEKAVCPSEIPFRGKIVRGSEIEYEFALALTPILDEENGRILFSLSMPGLDMVLDQVREDEYVAFCDLVKPLTELLILRNY